MAQAPRISEVELRIMQRCIELNEPQCVGEQVDAKWVLKLIAEVRRLREALGWYANDDHYLFDNQWSGDSDVLRDCGKRARAALGMEQAE